MTAISSLSITSIRNIAASSIVLNPGVNLFHGENGSGKTSVLEAVYTLSTGRSFRTSKLDSLISHGKEESVVFAELQNGQRAGFSKHLRKSPELKLDNDRLTNWELVARSLPTLVLDTNSFQLIEGGPKIRRAFIDWGVFHVEPAFIGSWRRVKKCVAHRNLLLKSRRVDRQQLSAWNLEFVDCSNKVDEYRRQYLHDLAPYFQSTLEKLAPNLAHDFDLSYMRGWDEGEALIDVLDRTIESDSKYGVTQSGPHRAELQINIAGNKAVEVLSRGQLKVTVMSLKIAQGQLLSDKLDHSCNYLVDDLAAELDATHRESVLTQLIEQNGQVFLTAVEANDILPNLSNSANPTTFHVERGIIKA